MLFSADKCNDACGFLAAFCGSLCYGSYGVPIKTTKDVPAHPLILQTYRTVFVFGASMVLVRLLEEPQLTAYGMFAGCLEVCGGMAGIMAIRNAGIALSIGTWASVMIVVNFFWGIVIFQEPVQSLTGTTGAFCMLGMGLIGMTRNSSLSSSSSPTNDNNGRIKDAESVFVFDVREKDVLTEPLLLEKLPQKSIPLRRSGSSPKKNKKRKLQRMSESFDSESGLSLSTRQLVARKRGDESRDDGETSFSHPAPLSLPIVIDLPTTPSMEKKEKRASGLDSSKVAINICSRSLFFTKRQIGIGCAVLNGVFGASALVPLHYAKQQGFTDFSYFFSFTSGCMVANTALWLFYFVIQCLCCSDPSRRGSISKTWQGMPRWHVKELWFKLLVAGLLYTGGMFGSILATSSLGQAVGNSLIQSKILISGLWGICCFQEIKDRRSITNWFLSATVSVASILWLSYERQFDATNVK